MRRLRTCDIEDERRSGCAHVQRRAAPRTIVLPRARARRQRWWRRNWAVAGRLCGTEPTGLASSRADIRPAFKCTGSVELGPSGFFFRSCLDYRPKRRGCKSVLRFQKKKVRLVLWFSKNNNKSVLLHSASILLATQNS